MGLFDSFMKEKDRDIVHLKNLILVASADSDFRDVELSTISDIMVRMGISEMKFQEAMKQLLAENKIKAVGRKMIHTGNVLTDIEAVSVDAIPDKLSYLQDYVSVMMADGSIDEREKALCQSIAKKMGLHTSLVDILITVATKKKGNIGNQEEKSSNSQKEPTLSVDSVNIVNVIMDEVGFLAEGFRKYPTDGVYEALLFCIVLAFRYGTIRNDLQQEILRWAVRQIAEDKGCSEHDMIDFVNARLSFYYEQIKGFGKQNNLCMAIYNALYCKPFCKNPLDLSDIKYDFGTDVLFYSAILKVIKHLQENLR